MNLHLTHLVLVCLSTYAQKFPTLFFWAVVALCTTCVLGGLYGFEYAHRRFLREKQRAALIYPFGSRR